MSWRPGYWTLWALAFASMLAGGMFQLLLRPDLSDGTMSFAPDWSRAAELLEAPGRVFGHSPGLFLANAALLAGGFALIFCGRAR